MYVLLATRGPARLERLEGASYRKGAQELHALSLLARDSDDPATTGFWEDLAIGQKLLWEVRARHLMVLIDAEGGDLEESEKMWASWYAEKLQRSQPQAQPADMAPNPG